MEFSKTALRRLSGFASSQCPPIRKTVSEELIEIETDDLLLRYRLTRFGFTRWTLSITLKENGVTWRYGQSNRHAGNLKGTARTLDGDFGSTRLEDGLISRAGWTVVDDSRSLVFNQSGWLEPRTRKQKDMYFFGYGNDVAACLQDFTRIAGPIPMIPRYILGNWWSRYWEYSQDELQSLMQEFRSRDIPLSVCIVDMDWHITKTGNTSDGWTGYTWNRELFPDPQGFIRWLHEQGLRTALNLHPARGIHPHEEQYEAMANWMGVDPASKEPIAFDITDPHFVEGYFEILHHPYEEMGVDFWWMDWQQGRKSRVPGLDPLWWINHLHYHDLGRDGRKRPFVFSRWGGLGNHRYPIGFSGDTFVRWQHTCVSALFHSHRCKCRLWVVESRHRRAHVQRRHARTIPALGAVWRVQPHLSLAFHQESRPRPPSVEQAGAHLPRRPGCHAAAACAYPVHLFHGLACASNRHFPRHAHVLWEYGGRLSF